MKTLKMKTTFRMKEATNKTEAVASIVDVLRENPLWTNKCTSDLFAVIKTLTVRSAERLLNRMAWPQVQNLFIELKTEFYNFENTTKWQ